MNHANDERMFSKKSNLRYVTDIFKYPHDFPDAWKYIVEPKL